MKKLLIVLLLTVLASCNPKKEGAITDRQDYDVYLNTKSGKTTSKYFELWNSKIKPDSSQLMSFGIVGGEYNRFFQNTGDITYLKRSEQVLKKAVDIAAIGRAGYYRALARNYISQHRFMEALQMADAALASKNGTQQSQQLLFDVHMELGNYETAGAYLDSIKDMSDFDYLIRLAKWNDYKGDLNSTIRFMEKAVDKAEKAKNVSLQIWSYTNLADYYGHAGDIEASYHHYLKALALDSANSYAKKGIAWIVFSYEKRPLEAMRILDSVTKNYKAPDYFLLKAEIADYMGDDVKSLTNLEEYFKQVSNPDYGDMYGAHNVSLYLNETGEFNKALRLAKKEVENRPTPESYALLAYTLFKLGRVHKAVDIVQNKIEGKTFEPQLLLYAAEVYKAAGKLDKVAMLKSELVGAEYELGPSAANDIKNL